MESKNIARRTALFQDLSGVGRCALTVAIPVLAAMNVQPCPIPTAVFSAHTAFPSVVSRELTDYLHDATDSWSRENFVFDAVLSGYLPGAEQAALIGGFIDSLRDRAAPFVLVDPAMADHGRLYRALPPSMPRTMRSLCARADLITPNLTEAALLTGRAYADAPVSDGGAAAMLSDLLSIGCGCAVITGVPMENGQTANLCMGREDPFFFRVTYDALPAAYPGTGDLFSAVLLGGLLGGDDAPVAMARATEFAYRAIARTSRLGTPPREGVQFEALLGSLGDLRGFAVDRVQVGGDGAQC